MQHFELPPVKVHRKAADIESFRNVPPAEHINWAGAIHELPDVWLETAGEGVTVAVLDTGIDTDHQDLEAAIADVFDFTGDKIEDVEGHGTHCAGIIAARLNGVGFVGVAPKSRLLIGKVLNNKGKGDYSWIATGIRWAVKNNADIISLSLGGPSSSQALFTAVHEALAAGKIIICAAGNSGSIFSNSIGYPGRYGSVITVASHDRNGNPSGFSSRGGEIDLMAPGSNIWSTYRNGSYAELSGTSMATPFVAGIAALILSKHRNTPNNVTPIDNNEDMRNHLLRMTAHPGHHDNASGYGPLQPFVMFSTTPS